MVLKFVVKAKLEFYTMRIMGWGRREMSYNNKVADAYL
jgi:hypothetical protein